MNPDDKKELLPEKWHPRPPVTINLARLLPVCRPLTLPRLSRDFEHQPVLERITETIVYSVLKFEYAVSPEGLLRQWLIFCLRIFFFIVTPAFLFLPLLIYIFTSINTVLESLLLGLVYSLIIALVAILLGSLVYSATRIAQSRMMQATLSVALVGLVVYLLVLLSFRITFETINATVLKSLNEMTRWWHFSL